MNDPLSGMSDTHERLEKLEKRVKILETTLEFFFNFQISTEMKETPYSEEYP
jgi:hypothetical protein